MSWDYRVVGAGHHYASLRQITYLDCDRWRATVDGSDLLLTRDALHVTLGVTTFGRTDGQPSIRIGRTDYRIRSER
jgi:hypothetical protein